jgi:hypothetical protein
MSDAELFAGRVSVFGRLSVEFGQAPIQGLFEASRRVALRLGSIEPLADESVLAQANRGSCAEAQPSVVSSSESRRD